MPDGGASTADPKAVGSGGRGVVWERDEDVPAWVEARDLDKEEDRDETTDDSSDESDVDMAEAAAAAAAAEFVDEDEQRETEFKRETQESLGNALKEGSAVENVVLEINASRHAYNMSMEEVLTTVTQSIVAAGLDSQEGQQPPEKCWKSVKAGIAALVGVMQNYVRKPQDQIIVLNAIEKWVEEKPENLVLVQKILFELNQEHEVSNFNIYIYIYFILKHLFTKYNIIMSGVCFDINNTHHVWNYWYDSH